MTISRRHFIEASALGALSTVAPRFAVGPARHGWQVQANPLRILILGGTGFIGPHMVRTALARGHSVTLFNRGRTNTHLFPEVEKLVGDRNGQLDALRGQTWDVAVDNSGYYPSHVRASAELLQGSVGHYLYTSTIDAYRDFRVLGIDENYPLATLPAGSPEDPRRFYGPLKALCEEAVRELYPDTSTQVRPGWIVGPGDNNHLFTYWVVRVDRGGEVLAPGEPTDPMQVTDVRDLAEWYIQIAEQRLTGAYNAVGPVISMAQMLYGIRAITSTPVSFTWVDADFLWERDIKPWTNIPIWWPPKNDWGGPSFGGIVGGVGALALDGSLARANGLQHHALADSAQDTLDWYRETYYDWPEDRRPGLAAGREAELLGEWKGR
jgi:2'-hydroxyisoflavone reductase